MYMYYTEVGGCEKHLWIEARKQPFKENNFLWCMPQSLKYLKLRLYPLACGQELGGILAWTEVCIFVLYKNYDEHWSPVELERNCN